MKTQRHCAYNLTTGEILTCSNGNHLKRCVAIVSRNDYHYGVRSEWIFDHKGINAIMAKRIKLERQGAEDDKRTNARPFD